MAEYSTSYTDPHASKGGTHTNSVIATSVLDLRALIRILQQSMSSSLISLIAYL